MAPVLVAEFVSISDPDSIAIERLRSRVILGINASSDVDELVEGAELKFAPYVVDPAQAPPPPPTIPVNGTLARAATVTLRRASVPLFPLESV